MYRSILSRILLTITFISVLLCTQAQTAAQGNAVAKKKIYYFELHQDIMPTAVRIVDRAIREAKEINADYIVMSLDSYGGLLDAGDSNLGGLFSP